MINPYENIQIFENHRKDLPNVSVFVGFKHVWMSFDPELNEATIEVKDIKTGEVYLTRKYGDYSEQDERLGIND